MPARRAGREPDRVVDVPVADLVPPQQPRQDRQPRGVRRRPAVTAQRVARQRPRRAGAGGPTAALLAGRPGLVEPAPTLVDDDGMHVPTGVAAALDAGVGAERVGDAVALAGVLEPDADPRVRAGHDGDRDPVVRAVAVRRAEVRVQPDSGRHVGEPLAAPRVRRQPAHVGVPVAVRREHPTRRAGHRRARGSGAGRGGRSGEGQTEKAQQSHAENGAHSPLSDVRPCCVAELRPVADSACDPRSSLRTQSDGPFGPYAAFLRHGWPDTSVSLVYEKPGR